MAALSGLLLAAAFPRSDVGVLIFVALVPLFLAMQANTPRQAAALGLVAGAVFFGILLEWIRLFTTVGWVLESLLQATYLAAFAWLFTSLRPNRSGWLTLCLAAVAWTVLEWVRSVGPCSLTWGDLAYALHSFLPLVQLVSVVGPFGLSFLVALGNAATADLLLAVLLDRQEGRPCILSAARRWMGVIALFGCAWGWGAWCMARPLKERATARVAVIQGNLGEEGVLRALTVRDIEEALRTYLALSEATAASHPDLIVWPESSVPVDLTASGASNIRNALQQLAARLRVDLVMGAGYRDRDGNPRNSAFLFTPDGRLAGRYDKVHLVPFGEYTPFRQQLGFLYRYFPVLQTDYAPGEGFYTLPAAVAPVGVAICFESSFPGIARTLRRAGARLLVVITNDAWFGTRSATWQHYYMAPFRAVETGCYLARAATRGFSAVIDPRGRERARTSLFSREVIQSEVGLSPSTTPYLLLGDWVVWASVCFLAVVGWTRWRHRCTVQDKSRPSGN